MGNLPDSIYRSMASRIRSRAQAIRDEHRSIMDSRKDIPFMQQPFDAGYWHEQLQRASQLEESADELDASVDRVN